MNERIFEVEGMTCAACSARVESAVSRLPGVDLCEVNLLLNQMKVSGAASDSEIVAAVERAGYLAKAAGKSREPRPNEGAIKCDKEKKTLKIRLISSTLILLLLMYISMGHIMWSFPLPSALGSNPTSLALIELVLSLSVLLINRRFFINGVRAVFRLSPNMDTLVALGSSVSFIYSFVLTFMISDAVLNSNMALAHNLLHGLYFESAAMIPALITLGKLLEAHAKGKTTGAINELMSLVPKTVTLIKDGKEVTVPISELKAGDIFAVRRGERVAADGVIVDGSGSFDEACLSGESIPADKGVGDRVFEATSLTSGFIKVRAELVGEDTVISEIIRTVKEASGSKAPVAKVADKVAGIFVPFVLLVSLVTFIIWISLNQGFGFAIERAVAVLVVSCPCALGLATPVAIMVGTGVGAKFGVLYKNASALEAAGKITAVALDKTGTITEGKPVVSDIIPASCDDDYLLRLAASLEAESEHPLARAIVEHYQGELYECRDFTASLGGVEAELFGERIFGGNPAFIEKRTDILLDGFTKQRISELSCEGKTSLVFASKDKILGIIALRDKIREDARQAVEALDRLGVKTVMLTGDNPECASAVAKSVGIKEYYAGVFPKDKEAKIKELKQKYRVLMVGDGINDAPALVSADIGAAIGKGANIAIDSADIVLAGSRLSDVHLAIRLGRRVLNNIYQNLAFAFLYNIIGIPLAAGAFFALGFSLKPMFGALAMSVSSFLVVSNALRLNLFRTKKCESESKTNQLKENKEDLKMKKITLKIEGMMCPHCSGRVKAALEAMEGVSLAEVSHESGEAVVSCLDSLEREALASVVKEAGYKVIG